MNWFITKEEKIQELQVLDELLSEDDENFIEKDSQLWIKHSNIAGFYISSAQNRF